MAALQGTPSLQVAARLGRRRRRPRAGAIFGLRARPKPVPSKPALQNPAPSKQVIRLARVPAERPACETCQRWSPPSSSWPRNREARDLARRRPLGRSMPKAKAMQKKGRSGARRKERERLAALVQTSRRPGQSAGRFRRGLLKLQDSEPPRRAALTATQSLWARVVGNPWGQRAAGTTDLDSARTKK